MTKYEIVSATAEHGLELARNLRVEDAREIWASGHMTPHRGVRASMKASSENWAGMADGRVVCIFGVAPLSLTSSTGVIWMLATPELENHARRFLRMNRGYIQDVRSRWPHLINFVHTKNQSAQRWLKWLGFKLHPPVEFGKEKELFHFFEMRA